MGQSYSDFIEGMLELNNITISDLDICHKNEGLYHHQYYLSLCKTYGQNEQVIVNFIEKKFKSIEGDADSDSEIDILFGSDCNAFLGVYFESQNISRNRQITNQATYDLFKEEELKKFDYTSFWEKKETIFPNLIFCENTEVQIQDKGSSKEFDQIMERLQSLNDYFNIWKTSGLSFNIKDCQSKTSLRLSNESESTMNNEKLKNYRIFKIPNGENALFEIHIKTGNLRIHIYPDNTNKKIYIGYIGPHLPT